MIYGKIVRSPHPARAGRRRSISSAAREGARRRRRCSPYAKPGAQVMYQGDPVAAVAADTEERARDAARLVRVRYEALPHLANVEQAMARRRAGGVSRTATRARGTPKRPGDLDAGFSKPRTSSRRRYSTHVISHVCLETHGTRVRVGRRQADRVGLDAGRASRARRGSRRGSSIPQANVRTITQYMGGGFGSKFAPDAQGIICAEAGEDGEGRR